MVEKWLKLHQNPHFLISVEESRKRVPIPLKELIDKSFEGFCILKLYQAYVGSTKSISLSVEEIHVTDRETSSSYFDED